MSADCRKPCRRLILVLILEQTTVNEMERYCSFCACPLEKGDSVLCRECRAFSKEVQEKGGSFRDFSPIRASFRRLDQAFPQSQWLRRRHALRCKDKEIEDDDVIPNEEGGAYILCEESEDEEKEKERKNGCNANVISHSKMHKLLLFPANSNQHKYTHF